MGKFLRWLLLGRTLESRVTFAAIILGCAMSAYGLVAFEPEGPKSCSDVEILRLTRCYTKSWCFLVSYPGNATQQLVGTGVEKPFATSYVGMTSLISWRGKWTGAHHFKFVSTCPGLPSNQRLERP
jgi:hypothetical protein